MAILLNLATPEYHQAYMAAKVAMERYYQKGPESLENQGGMGHRPRKMERSLQDPLPRTGRRRRKVRNIWQAHE